MSLKLGEVINRLSQNSETLSAILSHITDGVLLTDAAGNVVLSNQAAGAIFNFDENKATGKSAVEVLRDHQAVELVRSCLMTGQGKSLRFESALKQRLIYASVVPLPYGHSGGALLLLQDLTDILALQTMRKELIGNISHEFLTPLAGISAITETLRDGALADEAVAQNFLAKILLETERLAQMVRELGELARIEGAHPQLNMEMIDINRLVLETVEEIRPLAEKNQLKLSQHLAGGLPLLQADPDRLRHVLLNLMHNAVKFTPPGGEISIGSRQQRAEVVITVADTGIGIMPEALPRVFERFYKADRSRSKGGSGLGLAIVKHTVQAHGGRVWVESVPGRGATFSFSLPADKPAAGSGPTQ
jgi:two-component system phosphate regulon sensor histidine kinase PhoR